MEALCLYTHSREFGRIGKYFRKPSLAVRVHINFQILQNSLVFVSGYISELSLYIYMER